MNQQIEQMQEVAAGIVRGILITEGNSDVVFKRTVELEPGGKEVLVLGQVHREHNDGYCIAVLNPMASLLERLRPAVAFSAPQLKEIVRGKCDAMVRVMFLGETGEVTCTYQARGL